MVEDALTIALASANGFKSVTGSEPVNLNTEDKKYSSYSSLSLGQLNSSPK